jgi:hypothetical protein
MPVDLLHSGVAGTRRFVWDCAAAHLVEKGLNTYSWVMFLALTLLIPALVDFGRFHFATRFIFKW